MGKKQVLRNRKHGDLTKHPLQAFPLPEFITVRYILHFHPALQSLGMSIPKHCGTMLQCACLNFKDKSQNYKYW